MQETALADGGREPCRCEDSPQTDSLTCGRELNPVARVFSGSTEGLALNFAGETAGVIGLSYFYFFPAWRRPSWATSLNSCVQWHPR
jgi:hypothetical protein